VSVVITISDDGHIEATHNSGRVLWSMKLEESYFCSFPTDALEEEVAWWLEEALCSYDVGDSS